MKRRRFLQTALAAPVFLHYACSDAFKTYRYLPAAEKSFEFLEIAGSYREIGRAIGKTFARNIRNVMRNQPGWINKLMEIAESEKGRKYQLALMEAVRRHFPHLLEELRGTADGSGIHFKILWYMSIKSELQAFLLENPGSCEVNPGCSTIYYKNNGNNWLFHNEDGDAAYKNEMFVLKAHAPSGVSYFSFVYPGLITGVGPSLNSEGIIQSTNFIGCKKPEEGVPRYFLGRAILEAKTLKEAQQIAGFQPRAFPWHHNLASVSSGKYVSIETLPRDYKNPAGEKGVTALRVPKESEPYLHTNHTTADKTKDYIHQDIDYRNSSSISRWKVLSDLKEKAEYPVKDPFKFLGWLSSRRNAPYSPCRVADERSSGHTLGTAFFDINKGSYWLYKGPPCKSVSQARYHEYTF